MENSDTENQNCHVEDGGEEWGEESGGWSEKQVWPLRICDILRNVNLNLTPRSLRGFLNEREERARETDREGERERERDSERAREGKEEKVAPMVGSKFCLSRGFFHHYCLANTHGAHLRVYPSTLARYPPPSCCQ